MRLSRDDLIKVCLSRLGSPVINIDLSPEQINDAVQEAIDYWNRNHSDGVENINIALDLNEIDYRGSFSLLGLEDTIIGVNSLMHGNGGVSMSQLIDKYIKFKEPENKNISIDPITGKKTRLNISTGNPLQFDESYEKMLEKNLALKSIAPIGGYNFNGHGSGIKLYNRSSTTSGDDVISNILMIKRNLSELKGLNKYTIPFEFNNSTQSLSIRDKVGKFMVADCMVAVNPEVYPIAYNNEWLTNYATAKIQYYWGNVLSKFVNIGTLGDIKVDGNRILNDAKKDIEKLEEIAKKSSVLRLKARFI